MCVHIKRTKKSICALIYFISICIIIPLFFLINLSRIPHIRNIQSADQNWWWKGNLFTFIYCLIIFSFLLLLSASFFMLWVTKCENWKQIPNMRMKKNWLSFHVIHFILTLFLFYFVCDNILCVLREG